MKTNEARLKKWKKCEETLLKIKTKIVKNSEAMKESLSEKKYELMKKNMKIKIKIILTLLSSYNHFVHHSYISSKDFYKIKNMNKSKLS